MGKPLPFTSRRHPFDSQWLKSQTFGPLCTVTLPLSQVNLQFNTDNLHYSVQNDGSTSNELERPQNVGNVTLRDVERQQDIQTFRCHSTSFCPINNSDNKKCGPMPNVMVALPNIDGALCSTPQSLADAHY